MKITRNQFVTREKLDLARDLRKRMTPQEKILWGALRKDAFNQLHFRRQQVIAGYVVDFYCASARLAIEIDGDAHLNTIEYDSVRDHALAEMGIRTFRIRNQEVDEHLQRVLKKIADQTSPLTPGTRARRAANHDAVGVGGGSSRRTFLFPSPEGRGVRGEVMPDVTPVRENHRFDESRLVHYLRDYMPDFRGPLTVHQFVGGQSNPTFLLETADARFVMRKKPPGTLLPSAHAVEREYRIITALAATDVPVPRTHLLCEDAGVIGTPFFVMDFIDGRIMRDPMMPEATPADRAACYDSLNDVLARLHKVDFRAVGLGDYGRPQAYVQRQLARWTSQYEASKIDEIPEMDRLTQWLHAHIPADDETTIAHGDYRMENLIFHPVEPRVVAVLDWELSTLGHPLGDLAWACRAYHCPPGIDGVLSFQGIDLKAYGIPAEDEFVASYCKRVGRASVPDLTFFVAFSFFRGAAIAQGIAMRAKLGNASGPDAALRGAKARQTAEIGWAIAQRATHS